MVGWRGGRKWLDGVNERRGAVEKWGGLVKRAITEAGVREGRAASRGEM